MNSKKADIATGWIVIGIIITIVVFTIVMVAVVAPTVRTVPGSFEISLCKTNALVVSSLPPGLKQTLVLCHEQTITVDADNWKACDPTGKFGFEENNELKNCARQQVFNLADTCWDMYGRGNFYAGLIAALKDTGPCFKFKVVDLGKNETISEKSLTNFMKDNNYCKKIPNNDCDDDNPIADGGCGDCGSKNILCWKPDQKIDTQETWRIEYKPGDDSDFLLIYPGGTENRFGLC